MKEDFSNTCNRNDEDISNDCWGCCYFCFPIGCMIHEGDGDDGKD